MLSLTRALGLNLLFVVGICAAWAWFNVAPPPPTHAYRFLIKTNLPGWRFEPIPLNAKVIETLATTNLLNGTFHDSHGERISIFLGEWRANRGHELSVVAHTPDVCWTRAGWTAITAEFGNSMDLAIAEETIPFEVRVFRPPNGGPEELTLWCTLVNGQPYGELDRFHPAQAQPEDSGDLASRTSRRLAASHLLNALKTRTTGTGEKQFIRLSVEKPRKTHELPAILRDFARNQVALVK